MATRKGFICLDHLDRPPERRAGPRRLLHVQQTLAAPVWIVAGRQLALDPKGGQADTGALADRTTRQLLDAVRENTDS